MKRVLLFMIFLSFFQTTHLQSQHIDFTYQKAYPFFYPMTRGQIKILPDKEGLVYNLTYIQAQAQTSWNFFEKINWEGEYQWNHINGNSIGTGYFGQYIELWENGDFSIAVRKRTSSGFNTGVINRFDADGSSISNNGFTSTDPNIVFFKRNTRRWSFKRWSLSK